MNMKRWITLLLAFCLVMGGIAPAANAVHIAGENTVANSDSNWFKDLLVSAGEALGIHSVRDDKSHLKDNDYSLSLKDGKWHATTADGITVPLTGAQLPEHIQILQKAADHYQTMDMVTAFVVLGDDPTADTYSSIADVPAELTAALTAKQNDMLGTIENTVGAVDVVAQFTHLTNSIVITTAFGNLEPIAAIAGVKSVFISPVYEACETVETVSPFTVSSTQMTNVSTVWQELGYTGQGMTIAVLDTGLDLDHPSFAAAPEGAAWDMEWVQNLLDTYELNCEELYKGTLTARNLYYSEKVPFIFNYAMGTTNVGHNDGVGDHGTHVAGIAAANDVEGSGVVGMAPDAQIIVMKVFNSTTGGSNMYDLIKAVEDCMTMGIDVVNMSLGSPAGFSISQLDEIDAIFARIDESDMIADVAAGNEGTSSYGSQYGTNMQPTQHVDNATISSPSTYANSMSIGSVDNLIVPADYFKLADGTSIFYLASAEVLLEETDITLQTLKDQGELEYVIVDGLGAPEDFYDADGNSLVEGKIAVVRRGTLTFSDKVKNAEAAGAIAVMIWNTENSDIYMTTSYTDAEGNTVLPGIPAIMLYLDDGQRMADAEVKTLTVPSDFGYRLDSHGGQMSNFSCWGVSPDLRLLPDMSGVGGNVYSCYDEGMYGLMSGTSMATPQVAGVTALVLQYLKETFPEATDDEMRVLVDSLMMSTAVPVIDNNTGLEASPRQQGAGLVDALGAVTAEAYLTVAGSARPKAELGDNAEGKFSFTFTVHNYGETEKTYALRSSLLCEDYITSEEFPDMYFMAEADRALDNSAVTFSANSVTVPAGGTAEVTVTIELTEADKTWIDTYFPSGNYVEGFVYLESEGEVTLSLPFLGFYAEWDAAPVFDSGYWYEEGLWLENGAVTGNQYYHLLWTSLGTSNLDWMLGLNPYTGYVSYDENGKIVSMKEYSSYNNVLSPNGDGSLDQITEFYLSLMRNAEDMTFTYTNEDGEVLHSFLMEKESKTMYISGYGSVVPFVYSWYYDNYPLYDFSNVENGDVVYLEIAGCIDYEGARTDVMCKMPIHIDTAAPEMDVSTVVESSDENGNYLTLTFTDAHPAAVITMNATGSQIYDYYSDEVMTDNGDGTWTVTLDITGRGDKITVAICDYGCNESFYNLTYTLTENAPEMDMDALYGYQVFNELMYYYYGWDNMFGWTTINKENAQINMLQSDAYEYWALNAAEYVGGYIFAVDAGNNFLYMLPGVWNRNEICNIGYNVVDMAWDETTEALYILISDEQEGVHGLYTIDPLTGDLTLVKNYGNRFYMPWAMTFVDGTLYCCKYYYNGFYRVDFEDDYQMKAVTLDDGSAFHPKSSTGSNVSPVYAQSMTYSKADGKIYWAYYSDYSQDLITIDPSNWTSFSTGFASDQEYVGLLTLEDDGYTLPETNEITKVVLNDDVVIMSAGKTHQLSAKLLPWNAVATEDVVWKTNNRRVATVDENGLVTTLREGTATITATYGDYSASCTFTVVNVSGTLNAYKFYDGDGNYGNWLNIDLETVTEELSTAVPFDFMAADYNGHDGKIYGFDDAGQCYWFDPETGDYEALGKPNLSRIPADMAYDYSTGLMYAIVYDNYGTTLYTVNMGSGKLTEVASCTDTFLTLACTTKGKLYGINATGGLYELRIMEGEAGGGIGGLSLSAQSETSYYIAPSFVMQTPVEGLFYAQSMCYDHNNDVLLWVNPEYSTLYWLDNLGRGEEPFAIELGDPSGTGLIQYTGLYVVPETINELPFFPVKDVQSDDMLLLMGNSEEPSITINPANATAPMILGYTSADPGVAYVDENGMVVPVSVGSTTIRVEVADCGEDGVYDSATDNLFTTEFTVTVKQSTDNIHGYLMTDLLSYDGYYWMNIPDTDPANYAGISHVYYKGTYMTLYSAEYVDGTIYAYGYNDQDWNANFQFLTIDAKSWSVTNAIDMGDGFPFVYDMAFDYTTGTMYALAGSGSSATDLYYVNLANGELIERLLVDPMFMSLSIDENGTMYAMAASVEHYNRYTDETTYDNAILYTIDLENNTYEKFMDTGVPSNSLSSMAYDFDTGYLYWTGLFSDGYSYKSGLYLIDPQDKSCHNLGTIGRGGSQVTGLMIFADEYPEIPATLSSLAMTASLWEVAQGGSIQLETFVVPFGVDVEMTWTSSDETVATVNENGVVTGVSAGSVTITVTATDGVNTLSATCTVVVYGTDDYFISYNKTLGGFTKISRPDPSVVTQHTEAEDAAEVTAMAVINGVIYAYDSEGNLFRTSEAGGFQRDYIGNCGIEVQEPYEQHTEYTDGDAKYGYDSYYTPRFQIRDMAYDAANDRLLVVGTYVLDSIIYYWYKSESFTTEYIYDENVAETMAGSTIYSVDLTTGALEPLCVVGGEAALIGVRTLTVDDEGNAYTFSTLLDYVLKVDLETGNVTNMTTFQNQGIKGSSDYNDLMAMTYDPGTNSLVILFTTNGNAYSLYKFSLGNESINFMGYVGEVDIEYSYAYGDCFSGLLLSEKHVCDCEVIDTQGATCTEDGHITRKCQECGAEYTEVIESEGHDYDENGKCHCGAIAGPSDTGDSSAPVLFLMGLSIIGLAVIFFRRKRICG